MKRVLLTGAHGFIGRSCIDPLQRRGFEVHAVSRTPTKPTFNPGVKWHTVELLNPLAVARLFETVAPSHVLHAAWYTTHGNFWTATENAQWVRASLAIGEEFARIGGQRMVTVGTCAEYRWGSDRLSENASELTPSTFYGTCKHALHQVQAGYLARTGVSFGWGRVFFPYGPYESPNKLISSVIRALLAGNPAECSSGEQLRDFIYVEDAARALVRLLDSDLDGAVNIATGEAVSVADAAREVARQLQREDLLRLGALPRREGDPAAIVADTQRLNEVLRYQPHHDLQSGIAKAIEFWREHAEIRQ